MFSSTTAEVTVDAIRFEFLFSAFTSACVRELYSALLLFPKAVAALIAETAMFAIVGCSSLEFNCAATTGAARLNSVILLARDALTVLIRV